MSVYHEGGGVIVERLNQISDLAKGELRAWLEPWFEARGTAVAGGGSGTGPPGPTGPAGPPGPAGVNASFEFTQAAPSASWSVVHNLGIHPSVTVVDSGGSVLVPDIRYDSLNALTVSFAAPTSGKAYLN